MGRSLKTNAICNGMRQLCSILFPLITFPYISRILGSEGYGKYSFSQSITSYFILLASLGINTYAIREGAKIRKDKERIDRFCSQIFSINVCSALFSYVSLICFLLVNKKIRGYAPYILIESLAIMMTVLGTAWINGIYEDYMHLTIQYIAAQSLSLMAMFIFVRETKDIIPYCIISVLATNGGNLANIHHARKYVKVRFVIRMDFGKHVVPLLILFANSIAITIYVNSDIIMLGFYGSDATVGIYSFASRIYNMSKQIVNSMIVVSIPRVAYISNNHRSGYDQYINRIFNMLNIVLLPVTTGMFCMSDSIISIAGGPQYIAGDLTLKILSIATLFALYGSLFSNCVLIVNRQERKCLLATICSAFTNIILNFILLPAIGMIGAAITTIIAEAMNCLIQMHYAKAYLDRKKIDLGSSLSCLIGSIGIAAVCYLCDHFIDALYLKMSGAVIFSMVTYGGILILLKNKYVTEVTRSLSAIVKKVVGKE